MFPDELERDLVGRTLEGERRRERDRITSEPDLIRISPESLQLPSLAKVPPGELATLV